VSNSAAPDPSTQVGSELNSPRIDPLGREHLADGAESAAAEREGRWRLAAEAAADGLWEWNPATRELHWSPGVARMLGYEPGEILPTPETLERLIHPDDSVAVWRAVLRHLRGETPVYEAEYRLRHKDGGYRWVLSRGRSVLDDVGNPVRVVGSHTDVTERRRAEAERGRLLEGERRARAELESAHESKDEFLAALSHELRTPLTPTLTAVQLLERDQSLTAAQRELVAMVRRNVELEARLVDDLLDATRISRGKLHLHLTTTDVHEALGHVLTMCEGDVRSKRLDLRLELKAGRHHVQADPARLQQVLWNLLKNAAKFTPDGGTVGVRTGDSAEGRLRVEVWDTGCGIEPSLLSAIFEAFEQGGRGVPRRHGGVGLGLTISRSLAEMHGGTLTAFSDGKDGGSTFVLELPVTHEPALSAARPEVEGGGGHAPARILLVEDNPDTSRVMRRLLSQSGHAVRTADSVSAALRSAEAEDFDLLLCDIGLPDGTGHDLMRQLLARRPVRGIAISGYGMDEDVRKSREAGFVEHLTKPVDVTRLESAIHRLLATAAD
jgi:PAS domain S-box-containing protein